MPINESNFDKAIKSAKNYIASIMSEMGEKGVKEVEDEWDCGEMVYFSSLEYGSLCITGEGIHKYREVLNSLIEVLMVKGEEHFSLKNIESIYQTAILKSIDYTEVCKDIEFDQRLTQAVSDLKIQLRQPPKEWEMYLTVLGIQNSSLPFEAGKVWFVPGDSKNISEKLKTLDLKDVEKGETMVEDTERLAKQHYLGKSIAIIKVRAVDSEAAKRLAVSELRLHIDVLNHFSDILFVRKTRIYLPGDTHKTDTLSIGFAHNEQGPNCNISTETAGPSSSFSFDNEYLLYAKDAGLPQALLLLKEPVRNPFQNKILAAFQWSGRAEAQNEPESAFLMYAIALESLVVGGKNKSDVTYKIGTRCAHLLGKDLDSKMRIRKQMNDLYAVRSCIVHAGSFEVTPSNLGTLRGYAKSALAKIVTDIQFMGMTEEQDLINWFEERVLD